MDDGRRKRSWSVVHRPGIPFPPKRLLTHRVSFAPLRAALVAQRQALCQRQGQHGVVDFVLGRGDIVGHKAKFHGEGLIIQQDV